MAPDVAYDKPGHSVETITLEVDLVTVDDEDFLTGAGMSEDQPLMSDQTILFHLAALKALNIVVAKDKMETMICGESVQ